METLLTFLTYTGCITGGLVFLLFTASILGLDALDGVEADFDGDFDGGVSQYLSLRNLSLFLAVFSWTFIGMNKLEFNNISNLLISLGSSSVVVLISNSIMLFLYKQQENNILKSVDFVGKEGMVITTIHKGSVGQIEIYNPKYMVIEATSVDFIPKGTIVKITNYSSNSATVETI